MKKIFLANDYHFQGFVYRHVLLAPAPQIFLAAGFQSIDLVLGRKFQKSETVFLWHPKIPVRVNTLKHLLQFWCIFARKRYFLAVFSLKFEDNMASKTGEDRIKTARWTWNSLSATLRTKSLDFHEREKDLASGVSGDVFAFFLELESMAHFCNLGKMQCCLRN